MKKLFMAIMAAALVTGVQAEIDPAIAQDEGKLLELIQKGDTSDNDMVTACQNLSWRGTAAAVAPLAKLLESEKAHIRHAARYGLEGIPGAEVAEALNQAALKLQGPALVGVLQSLGSRGNDASVAILKTNLASSDKAIAAAAAQALGKIESPAGIEVLRGALGSRPCVAVACMEAANLLADKKPSAAVPYFSAVYKTAENVPASVRNAAALGVIVNGGRGGLKLWDSLVASGDKAQEDIAMRAVLDVPASSGATKNFAAALKKVPAVQQRLAAVLAQRGDKAAIGPLAALANDSGSAVEVRLTAAAALATMAAPQAVAPLLELSGVENGAVASAASNEIVGFVGKAADSAVLAMFKSKDVAERLKGIELALRRRMAMAVPGLSKLTSDSDPKVVEAAVRGLGELGTDKEIPSLLRVIAEQPDNDNAIRSLISLNSRYARPRGGKTIIKYAGYGRFEENLVKDVTENAQRLVDAGSITIQATGRLCRRDGFSEDPAPGKLKSLRLVYTFDGVEKSASVMENDSYHLSGVTLLPVAMDPLAKAYAAAEGQEKRALFRVITALGNEQALESARAAAQDANSDLREDGIRALIDWKTPDALNDVAALLKSAPSDRLKILAMRGFVRQLELAFTISNADKIPMLEEARKLALRDEERALVDATLKAVGGQLAEEGFKLMFDGKSLAGWKGGGGWWEAKDGILQAQSSTEKPCKQNSHLIWTGGQPGDFEMRAEFKLSPGANSGIQVRSLDEENKDTGYQADMNGTGDYVGFLYHPAQHLVGERGAKVVINAKGEKKVDRFADAKELGDKVFKKDDWNEYRIICKGPAITLFVNGTKTCEFEDHRPNTPLKGTITLQMHAGPPMKIQFRNMRIREL